MFDDPDDIVIEWARKQDVFSDQVVYETNVTFGARDHQDTRKPAETGEGEIDIDEATLGSFREQEAVEECRRLRFLLLERILLILADGEVFDASCTLQDTVPVQGRSREAPIRLSERGRAQLFKAGYFIAATQQVIRYASFFLVAKSNGHWRGVVNGIPGNEVLAPPHYFTFFTSESWVRRLRALGKFFAVCVWTSKANTID